MKFKKPENLNYCATIIQIKKLITFSNCDNIQGALIFGNQVIVSIDVKVGDIGIFFPTETQLNEIYVSENNLYRHNELNKDNDKKGYLEDNRRIRTIRMRQNESCGLFMPLESLSFCYKIEKFKIGDTFDEINKIKICNKYIIKIKKTQGLGNNKKYIKKSKLLDKQFKFHKDTLQLGKNMHKIKENTIIQISYKVHGTSVIISKVLCKKKLNYFYKFLKLIRIKIIDTIYDNLYSSRKVVKNDDMNPNNIKNFYNFDIWGIVNDQLKEYLNDGLTIYAEIVGYLPDGGHIQKGYDYGCKENTHSIYIYRITYTNITGTVFEFSTQQMREWCEGHNLQTVPELYYGKAIDFFKNNEDIIQTEYNLDFNRDLLEILIQKYLKNNCYICKNKVPVEGIVVRTEKNQFEAFKLKSFEFLKRETKQLDKGVIDIEEQN